MVFNLLGMRVLFFEIPLWWFWFPGIVGGGPAISYASFYLCEDFMLIWRLGVRMAISFHKITRFLVAVMKYTVI